MASLWFVLIAWMLATYVVLDGFDLGAAVAGRFVALTPAERQAVARSIGPVWDCNEVWLVAAGGSLYLAFPVLYAVSFSGFYLPLMLVLWLLIGRGLSLELRHHVESPLWAAFWDGIFFLTSLLLCVVLGAALGNVVRGVPLAVGGDFFLPLWTDFRATSPAGILDWYTLLAGGTALAALALHGALWLALKLPGELEARAWCLSGRLVWVVTAATALLTWASFGIQPLLAVSLRARPWGALFPLLAVGSLVAIHRLLRRPPGSGAFIASSLYLAGMFGTAASGLYPYVLPAIGQPSGGLTAAAAATSDHGLRIGLAWWLPGMILAAAYTIHVYRRFAGKVDLAVPGEY
jgi:cytochrome d ubiquinol oxidase subunit II